MDPSIREERRSTESEHLLTIQVAEPAPGSDDDASEASVVPWLTFELKTHLHFTRGYVEHSVH
jgi:hypothetical protein